MLDIFRGKRGSKQFRRQLEESRERLYRVAYSWCHDAYLADDLVQQTLIKGLERSHQLRDDSVLDTWLFRILTNCWRDHFRRQRETVDIDEVDHWHEQTPEREHRRSELVDRVRGAIGTLPQAQREVVTLVDLGGLSYTEVAEVLEIPIGTVMSRLCRARRALKDHLFDLNPGREETDRPHLRSVK